MRLLILAALCLFGTLGCSLPGEIRVMSYNIRYDNPDDGVNAWSQRRLAVVERIAAFQPDVIGLQEVLHHQLEELSGDLPDYQWVGVGRDDGRAGGEFVPILYDKRQFRLERAGHYWLSEQPGKPGSIGWDAALPRLITWARLVYKRNPLVKITVLNTHFDHVGETARLKSAEEVRLYAESLGGQRVIVLGDFNATPDSRVHEILTEDRGNLAELRDTWFWKHGKRSRGTFNGFEARLDGPRIDWILCNRRFEVEAADVDQTLHDGRPPSDHFPVTAILKLVATSETGML